jgi:hypothetical protein
MSARLDQGPSLLAEVAPTLAIEIREQHDTGTSDGLFLLELVSDVGQGCGQGSLAAGAETFELADEGRAERRNGGTGKALRERAGVPRLVTLRAQGDLRPLR